jgi:hypothetical protein
MLKKELDSLATLDYLGLPVPEIVGKTVIDGKPAYIMKKYVQGSKDICRTVGQEVVAVGSGTSPHLNQNSIQDLKAIKFQLKDKNLSVNDLQFLIDSDGHVYIADPAGVVRNTTPTSTNIDTIDFLIRAAGGTP